MNKILTILIALTLLSCTKIDKEYIFPNSLPYKLKLIDTYSAKEKHTLNVKTAINPIDNKYYAFYTQNSKNISNQDRIKSFILYGLASANMHRQINFTEFDFKGFENVYAPALLTDINANGIMDMPMILQFADSLVLGVFEFDTSKHSTENWIKWHSIRRLNNHYMDFLMFWDVPESNTKFAVLRTTNRLLSEIKEPDILILLNLETDEVIRIPVAPYFNFGQQDYIYNHSHLILNSAITNNGLEYMGMNDRESFSIAIDTLGNIVWHDNFGVNRGLYSSHQIFNNYSINAKDKSNKIEVYFTDIFSFEQKTIVIESDNLYYYMPQEDNLVFIATKNKSIIAYDTNARVLNKRNIGLDISSFESNFSPLTGHAVNSRLVLTPSKYEHYDFNNDNYYDFIALTKGKQFIAVDGRTLKVLFATDNYDNFASITFARRDSDDNLLCYILDGNKVNIYEIVANPWNSRLLVYKAEVYAGIIIFFLLPFLLIAFVKIDYHNAIFKSMSNRSKSEAIIVINKKRKIIHINNSARGIFNLEDCSENALYDFLYGIINNLELNKYEFHEEIHLSEGNNKIFNIIIKDFKTIIGRQYFLITFSDVTDVVEAEKSNNMIRTALMITHNIKNLLGTAQLQLDDFTDNVKKNNIRDEEYIDNTRKIISESILEAGDVVRRISYIARDVSYALKTPTDIGDYIDNWIIEYGNRYKRRGIKLINLIEHVTFMINLNTFSFNLLLQTACDNSAEAFEDLSKEDNFIEFSMREEQNKYIISIKDNGCGMDIETITKLKQNIGYSSKRTGSGLGMPLIFKVAKENNAKIDIISNTETGTTLEINFFDIIKEANNET